MVNDISLDERKARAAELHKQGYNCAQSVILAFPEIAENESEPLIAALTAGFGGGVCASGEICGVASALAVATGLRLWKAPADKKNVYAEGRALVKKFEQNNGYLRCRDLKKAANPPRPCPDLISDGVAILAEYLAGN